ncbi:ABC transporter permease [Schaalia sp. 19OD2882]|uniref:ABC transporter permease n=1 Tax=Schaalia sp. 19OD2882 TaxID=2794089 RepID=UPI001C1EC6B0|nr:ABC transporter permease [Schaalia sp. 19OD2882]QWW20058.1 ABC transporter permease [Schaalia sp. 19OD2882]
MSPATATSTAPVAPEQATTDIIAPVQWRDPIVAGAMTVCTMAMAFTVSGASRVSFSGATTWFETGEVSVPAGPVSFALLVASVIATEEIIRRALARKVANGLWMGVVGAALVTAFLLWTVAGKETSVLPVVSLLAGGLAFATPLVFGSLAGVVCERTGIINIAIEGQLLFGAFLAAIAASAAGSAWVGLLAAPVAGMLVSVLLALFTVKYRADHIVVGVVLNMLVLGVTSFVYSTQLKNAPELNQSLSLGPIGIPLLKDIPVIGPVLFNQSILVYLMYATVIGLQVALFRSKWGLHTRACGEHPKAADTVGIKVNAMRWQNTLLAGAIAGLGGAFFTIGEGLAFTKDMSAGNGFIALAAMILGRWNPKGALFAALLFGFATNMGNVMQAVGATVPTEFLLMIPYLVTILAVAGFVGAVRAPAAEGVPYP